MNGPGLHSRRFAQPFGCASRWCSQQDPGADGLECPDNAQGCGCLTGSRAAGQDQNLAFRGSQDRLQLHFIILNSGHPGNTFRQSFRFDRYSGGIAENLQQPSCGSRFGEEERGKIYRRFLRSGYRLRLHILRFNHFVQCDGYHTFIHTQKLGPGLYQLFPGGIAVTVVRQLIQGVQQSAAQPDKPVMLKSQFFRDCIRRFKSDPPDIIRKPVWILLDHLDALIAVCFIDLCRMSRTDIMALQEEHDVLDLFLILPAFPDPFHPDFPDSRNLQQTFRRFLDDNQCVLSELPDNRLGKLRPDALDQSGAQIFFNSINGRREGFGEGFHAELPSVLRVHLPVSGQFQNTADMHLRHISNDSNQIVIPFGFALDNRITVCFVLICNALHHAPQPVHSVTSVQPAKSS